jgi:hypothetical protein
MPLVISLGRDRPADPPAGHRVGLGDAVDHDRALGRLGGDHGQRVRGRAAVDQVLVDLVGDHPDAVLGGPAADRLDLLARVDRAGGVRGGDEHHGLGARGAVGLEHVHRGAEAGRLVGGHPHDRAARELDLGGVADPVGGGDEHLVTRVDERHEDVVQRVLAAVGDHHVGGVDLQAAVALGLGRDRLPQGRLAGRGRVAVVGRVRGGALGRLDDVVRGGEVRLARAEADDRLPGGLERLGLGRDGQGRGFLHVGDALGESHGLILCCRWGPVEDSDSLLPVGPVGRAGRPGTPGCPARLAGRDAARLTSPTSRGVATCPT